MTFDRQPAPIASEPTELARVRPSQEVLSAEDQARVQELAASIDPSRPATLTAFGMQVQTHIASYVDSVLGEIRNADLQESGYLLTQMMGLAQNSHRSRVPFIGPIIDRMAWGRTALLSKCESTLSQMQRLTKEVERRQGALRARNTNLDGVYAGVCDEYRLLGLHMAAGELAMQRARDRAQQMRGMTLSPMQSQELADLDAFIARLDVRLADLEVSRDSALQTLPQIRITQSTNDRVHDKFATITTVTFPAWKRNFMIMLCMREQRDDLELTTAIDNATDSLMRRLATAMKDNAIDAARASQRLAISPATVTFVNTTMVQALQESVRETEKGVAQRARALEEMRTARRSIERQLRGGAASAARPGGEFQGADRSSRPIEVIEQIERQTPVAVQG